MLLNQLREKESDLMRVLNLLQTLVKGRKHHIAITVKVGYLLFLKGDPVVDLRGGAQGTRPNFFHFHAVFGKKLLNNRLAPPWG